MAAASLPHLESLWQGDKTQIAFSWPKAAFRWTWVQISPDSTTVVTLSALNLSLSMSIKETVTEAIPQGCSEEKMSKAGTRLTRCLTKHPTTDSYYCEDLRLQKVMCYTVFILHCLHKAIWCHLCHLVLLQLKTRETVMRRCSLPKSLWITHSFGCVIVGLFSPSCNLSFFVFVF